MKRTVWFLGGVAAGVSGSRYARRKVNETVDRLRPANLVDSAGRAANGLGGRVVDAVKEGVSAGRRHERELRAQRDGRLVRLADHLHDDDELLIDGEIVDSGRVIVMRRPTDS